MKFVTSLSLLFFFSFTKPIFSQQKIQIQGIVFDSTTQKALEFATVFLFLEKSETDSAGQKTPIASTFSDEKGRFSYSPTGVGEYWVQVSMVGFRSFSSEKKKSDASLNFGNIFLSPNSANLQEVTITAQKPLLEVKADRVIFNAEADPTNDGGTGLDVLRKVPFVTVDSDDNITLKGKSNFLVQLNGKNTGIVSKNPKEALRAFPSSIIKRVEVITTPGARYDAEGVGGIINIVTLGKVRGVNGNVSTGVNTLGQMNHSASINVKLGDWGFSTYGGLGGGITQRNSNFDRTNFFPTNLYQESRVSEGRGGNLWGYINAELAYDIDSLKSLSVYYSPNNGSWRSEDKTTHIGLDTELRLVEQGLFTNDFINRWPGQTFGADYIQNFKKEKQELTFSWAMERDNGSSDRTTSRVYDFGFIDDFASELYNKNKEIENTLEVNYVHPISEKYTVSAGAKNILRRINNEFWQNSGAPNGSLSRVVENSGIFHYNQDVYAGYGELEYSSGNWALKPGFRYEKTSISGDTDGLDAFSNEYETWIPTFSLSYKLSESKNLRFAYSKRIQRPGRWYLQPQNNNVDPRYVTKGNPLLDPEILHGFELGYSIFSGQNSITLTLEESFTNNTINQFQNFDPQTGVVTSTYLNLGSNQRTALSSYISLTALENKLTFYTNFSISYDILEGYSGSTLFRNEGVVGYGYTNLQYKLKKDWQVQGNGWLGIGTLNLQGRDGNWFNYQLGISKKLFETNSLRLGLQIDQPFHKERQWTNTVNDAQFTSRSQSITPARAYRVTASWRFGKLKEDVSRKKGVSNSDTKSGSSGN